MCSRGRRAKPMGSAAQDRAYRTGKRTMGAASTGERNCWVDRNGSLWRQGARLSPHDRRYRFPSGADESPGNRALSYDFAASILRFSPKYRRSRPCRLISQFCADRDRHLKNRTLSPVAQLSSSTPRSMKPLAKRNEGAMPLAMPAAKATTTAAACWGGPAAAPVLAGVSSCGRLRGVVPNPRVPVRRHQPAMQHHGRWPQGRPITLTAVKLFPAGVPPRSSPPSPRRP
jgi:hypothetical protein